MRLALLAVVLACCRADEARRRPARPMRQRDVDRWRARMQQPRRFYSSGAASRTPPASTVPGRDDPSQPSQQHKDFRDHLARLRQQTIDAKQKRQQPPPQAPTPSYRPAPIPVNITCPATRRGCAYDREGGFGAGAWERATPDPRPDGWMERWNWRLGTQAEWNRTRDALAWRWRAACRVCAMTPPADLVTPAQLCARFAAARVRRLLVVGDSTSQGFYDALVTRLRATKKMGIPFPDDPKKTKFAMTRGDACNTSLRLAFLRDDYLWGDGAILPNATCTALAAQGLAVLDKCGDRRSLRCHGRISNKPACRDDVVDRAHWASSLLPKWDVVVANTGAHQHRGGEGAMAHAVKVVAGKLANGTGDTTFLFRGLYRPVYGCRETYLAGPSTPEKIEAVEEELASRDVDPQNRGDPAYLAQRDAYRWHQFLDFEATVEQELLRKVPNASLYDVGPLVTARTDLHARDCLHFHALPGSRAGVFKWWIPMLLDYVTEMRRPGAPPMNYSSARKSQNLGFNAWQAALRERAATSNGISV